MNNTMMIIYLKEIKIIISNIFNIMRIKIILIYCLIILNNDNKNIHQMDFC